jgi:ribosome-associated translation inhibitor RaiA
MPLSMRLNVQHLNLPASDPVDSWVENQIFALGRARQIDEANIRLIRLENASPAYQVNVHLVTPGPDVFAESRDHTLRAAFTKVMAQLREQIALRAGKRLQRMRSKSPGPVAKSRGPRGL